MKIPVLAYHAANIAGNEYHNNDHIAFHYDLKLIKQLGVNILSAIDLINWLYGKIILDQAQKYVVITFDDGNELEFIDGEYPVFGFQNSFYKEMKKFDGYIHVTSFVISSPKVRRTLETTCLGGFELLGEQWWQKAEDSKMFSIENHSWDHLHPSLNQVKQKDNLKGDFSQISCLSDADAQIEQSSLYINARLSSKETQLFAYPFGHYNSYLIDEYLPRCQNKIKAAFTCDAQHVTQSTNVWKVPRYVCGFNWKTIEELRSLIIR